MQVGNCLIRRRRSMVDDQRHAFNVPKFLPAHLMERLDRKRRGCIGCHHTIHADNGNIACFHRLASVLGEDFFGNGLVHNHGEWKVEKATFYFPLSTSLCILAGSSLPRNVSILRESAATFPISTPVW